MSRSDRVLITPAVLRGWPLPGPGDGKESRGTALVVGGTTSTPGAVLLAGEAALRAGAGKLILATTATTVPALGVAVPECMTVALPATSSGDLDAESATTLADYLSGADAVLVGPGFSDPEGSVALVERLVEGGLAGPLVLDATASAYLTEHPQGLRGLDRRVVLTANPSELAHTAHCSVEEVEEDPIEIATRVARDCAVVVLCGGTDKHVVTPEGHAWTFEGGGPGLGVSGSGDVQAGIVGGLLARGADAAQAAVWGAYLHGRAGERLAAEVGPLGYLARELVPTVPRVLAELRDH